VFEPWLPNLGCSLDHKHRKKYLDKKKAKENSQFYEGEKSLISFPCRLPGKPELKNY